MTGSRRRALLLLAVMAAWTARAQGPGLPLPFDRFAPAGDPPAVPGVENDAKEQPEPLGRGPIHEAFAQPSDSTPRPSPVVPKAPPAPVREAPPEQKPEGPNVTWVPGYWMWDDDRADFVWVSGFWRVPPPNRKWVPGYWAKAEGGHRWVSGFWAVADRPAVPYSDPPPESLEAGPNQPAPEEGSQWVPGTWLPQDDRWLWQPGFWAGPQPGWLYTPARYCWTPRGCVFVNGFWDRDLQTRGVPFAPVFLPQSLCASPNFLFTPTYSLNLGTCLGSLWARPSWNYFAFGDFYGPVYGRLGFQPWFQYGPRVGCPLFAYYRNVNVWKNPNWAAGLAATHQGRVNGKLPVPPRSLAAQARLANPTATTLLPLTKYNNASLPLARTPAAERAAIERSISATGRAVADRAREEQRRLPGGVRPGPLSLSTVPTPSSPLTAARPVEPARSSVPTTARPLPRVVPGNSERGLSLPPPREAARTMPVPSVVPSSPPRALASPRGTLPPASPVAPTTRFSPPTRGFTMPPTRGAAPLGPRGFSPGGRPGGRR